MTRTHWVSSLLAIALIAGGVVSCSTDIDPMTGEVWDEGGDFGNEMGTLMSALSLSSGDSCCTPEPGDGAGCNDTGCSVCVCDLDPYCCGTEWDQLCVDRAANSGQCLGACKCTTQCLSPVADVNGTNSVNVLDVQCVLLVSLWELSGSPGGSIPVCLAVSTYKADLNCSGTTNVGDVLVAIPLALSLSLDASIDANGDDCPDACVFPPPDPCAVGAVNCDDGDRCTENDKCAGGTCKGTTKNCNDGNACTSDHCDSDGPLGGTNTYGSCYHNDISWTCTDTKFCTKNYCDTSLGCIVEPQNSKCNDGNQCTGTNVAVSVSDICVAKHYDANGNGTISASESAPNAGDADGCSFPDISFQCNDGLPCTADSCIAASGCKNVVKCASVNKGAYGCHNTANSTSWGLAGSVNTGSSIPAGTCFVSVCDQGWFDFDGAYTNGCSECNADGNDKFAATGGDSSSDPIVLSNLHDNASDSVNVTGNLLTLTNGADEDWFKVRGIDDKDNTNCGNGNGDNYHLRVRFSKNPSGFKFDVYQAGSDSFGAASQVCSGVEDWEDMNDFLTNSSGVITGGCPCTYGDGSTDKNQCDDNSGSYYWIRVYRPSGATINCDSYTLEASNGVY